MQLFVHRVRHFKKEGTLPVSWHTFAQTLYITVRLYSQNGLPLVSQASAFGLMFSLFPIVFLILSMAMRLLRGSADIMASLYPYFEQVIAREPFEAFVEKVLSTKQVGIAEVIVTVSILWIARRFFISLMSGFNKIFHLQTKHSNVFFTIGAAVFEVVSIVLSALLLVNTVFLRSVKDFFATLPVLPRIPQVLHLPQLPVKLLPLFSSYLPFLLLLLVVFLTYRFSPGTRPSLKLCAWCALSTVGVFWLFLKFFGLFANLNSYNLVYGVLANVMVFLLELLTFFYIYFFLAQYIFVYQFFKELLLAELYLLPPMEDTSVPARLRRKLFLDDKWIASTRTAVTLEAGERVFCAGDEDDRLVYYVAGGTVLLESGDFVVEQGAGTFFGEMSTVLERPREMTCTARTAVTLVKIDRDTFVSISASDPEVTKKLLSKMSTAFV